MVNCFYFQYKLQCLLLLVTIPKANKSCSGLSVHTREFVCVFCFVSCKTLQMQTFRNYLHEVNSKFQNNRHYECEAIETLCFVLSHTT